jgi:hypothetical protein
MAHHLVPANEDEHRYAQQLLPWYATGRLDPAEQARIAVHVATCPACQADLALDRALASSDAAAAPQSADEGWWRLKSRIDGEGVSPIALEPGAGRDVGRFRFGGWREWAIAAEFALILLLVGLLALPRQPDSYQALGRAQADHDGDLIVIFRPETREESMRGLLSAARARVVDGPTVTGAYVLQSAAGGQSAALARLKASPAVTLAEALDPETAP